MENEKSMIVKIGSVANINASTYKESERWPYINYLDTSNIVENSIIEVQHLIPGRDEVPSRARRKVEVGDIIYSTVRPNQRHYGYISSRRDNFIVSTGFATIRAKSNAVDSRFLYYYLTQVEVIEHLQSIAEQSTSTYPSIKPSDIESIEIKLFTKEIQRSIAATLSCLDDKIELNTRIIANLEAQAQAIFKSWFVDFEPFQDGEFEDSELGLIPKGWRVASLEDLCTKITKGTTPTTLGLRFSNSGVSFVKAECIQENHMLDFSKLSYIDEKTNQSLIRSQIDLDDIIFSIAGTIGRFAIVDCDILPANTNQAVAIIRPDKTKISPLVLYSFFLGDYHKVFFTEKIQQAVQANLSLSSIRSLKLPIPPFVLLSKYSLMIEPIIIKLRLSYKEIRKLSELRDTLLPKLMSGEIEVPVEG